ncbi:MAG: PLP-dependent aminotransferase family protein, partial [Pseudoalteromonas sp.]|uniref:aminotransferase class I/II-fold pyridoxal phosphate-dependent enzyme n=1 Tax=Pseudoalteromonas sp. TaxID=53249 RepID=UPI0025EB4558
ISVSSQAELISAKNVQLAFEQVKLENKEVGGLYIIPDFDNPSGESFSSELRNELLEVCNELKIAIFEDNPYGRFRYDGGGVTTMYEMDKFGVVYHLGSFAKTVCPTMRIGYILCPTVDFIGRGYQEILDNLSKVKSLLSVNTSQLAQAVVGGILLENDCSLEQLNGKARTFYRSNRDTMLEALEVEFSDMKEYVSWNNPEGGFFLTVKLPFIFDKHQMEICASEYDVLVMPRAFFSVAETQDEFVRFAFSYVSPELIKKGIKSFARYVRTTMNKAGVLTNV